MGKGLFWGFITHKQKKTIGMDEAGPFWAFWGKGG